MEYVKLGNTGMDVSPICLGTMSFGTAENWVHNTWALDEEGSRTIIKRALDLGVNFFDTANVYAYGRSEEILGRALNDFANRDEILGHQGFFADEPKAQRRRPVAQAYHEPGRPEPEAAGDGLH